MKFSESLTEFSKDEKSFVNNLFDRETRRERILNTIEKEESFANKMGGDNVGVVVERQDSIEDRIKQAEDHYYDTIKKERDLRVTQLQKMMMIKDEKDI